MWAHADYFPNLCRELLFPSTLQLIKLASTTVEEDAAGKLSRLVLQLHIVDTSCSILVLGG